VYKARGRSYDSGIEYWNGDIEVKKVGPKSDSIAANLQERGGKKISCLWKGGKGGTFPGFPA